jgi:PST family polysaccharide transporter
MSLGLVQMANCIIPILIIPFVVRALGVEFFGKASYAQNIISYLTLIVTYGFEYSATQDIAINRGDKSKLRTIFWTVVRFKVLLLAVSFAVLAALYFTFSKAGEDPTLYFYAALLNVGMVLFPTWFFQGIEKMKNMAIFNFAVKALGAVLVVLLVRVPTDYRTYILILSMSYVLVGIFSFIYVIKKYDLKKGPNKDKELSRKVIRKGFPIFLNNVFVSLYTAAGLTIIGIYLSNVEIGLYAGTNKIVYAVMMLTSTPVNIALFPLMSRKFDESKVEGWIFFKKSLLFVVVWGVLVSVLLFLFAPYAVNILLGNEFTDAVSLLRLFSPLPFLVITASMLTVQGLYGMQMQKYAPYVGLFLGIFSISLNLILIPCMGIKGAAVAWLSSQSLEIVVVGILLTVKMKKV